MLAGPGALGQIGVWLEQTETPSLCLLFPAPLAASAVGPAPVFAVNQADARLQLKNNLAKKEWAHSLLQTATQPTDCFASAMGGHCKGELALTSWP